jgi:hypothetical protein
MNNLKTRDFYPLQFDESADVAQTAQLTVTVRMVFNDNSTKEEILTFHLSEGKTRAEDMYHAFKDHASDISLPLQKLKNLCLQLMEYL